MSLMTSQHQIESLMTELNKTKRELYQSNKERNDFKLMLEVLGKQHNHILGKLVKARDKLSALKAELREESEEHDITMSQNIKKFEELQSERAKFQTTQGAFKVELEAHLFKIASLELELRDLKESCKLTPEQWEIQSVNYEQWKTAKDQAERLTIENAELRAKLETLEGAK